MLIQGNEGGFATSLALCTIEPVGGEEPLFILSGIAKEAAFKAAFR